jgi:hypothetical protein
MITETKAGMAEQAFRIAAIKTGNLHEFRMYSRNTIDETSYCHGLFNDLDEALYSVEMRCDALNIRFTRSYAKRLIEEGTY